MKIDENALTPMEAAHNVLVLVCFHFNPPHELPFLAYLFSKPTPYLEEVREMVYAELPFWRLLDEAPPSIPFSTEE